MEGGEDLPSMQNASRLDDAEPKKFIAVCLVVRRLENLDRLLPLFMVQPYGNCHVFVAVKGMTEDNFPPSSCRAMNTGLDKGASRSVTIRARTRFPI